MSAPATNLPSHPPAPGPAMGLRDMLLLLLRTACWIAIVVGLALGLYLTLRSTGSFNDLWWMPRPVRHWAEYNGRLRNLPAFALLAVPFMIVANGRRARRWIIAGLAVFVVLTELAQYYIPGRWCEWQDVTYGWTGLLATWLGFEVSFWSAWRIRQTFKRRKATSQSNSAPPVGRTARPHQGGARP